MRFPRAVPVFSAPGRPVLGDEISLPLRITISTYCFGMSLNEFTKAWLGSGEGGAVDGHNPGKSGWKGRVADRGLQCPGQAGHGIVRDDPEADTYCHHGGLLMNVAIWSMPGW